MKYICIGTLVIAAIGLLYFWPASASIIFGAILLAGYFAWKSYAGSLSENNSSAWRNSDAVLKTQDDSPSSTGERQPNTLKVCSNHKARHAGINPAALTLSAGTVLPTLPKTPVTPLCPVTAPAVPAASISAGAIKQQAEPSASARSAAPAASNLVTVIEGGKCGSRLSAGCKSQPNDKRPRIEPSDLSRNSIPKPRWALKPGTIARLNEEVVR